MATAPKEKETKFYNVNLSDKINKSLENAKSFKLDLASNVERMKNSADSLSRKEINLNFIDRFTRMIYSNQMHLVKLEMLQYFMFIVLIYYYNPFDIGTKFPAFTNLLVLGVSFLYVVLFIFIREKVSFPEDVDLINPTESGIIFQFIATILLFVVFMLAVKGVIWLLMNTEVYKVVRHLMSFFITIGVLGIVYLFMKKTINRAKNAPGRKFSTLLLKFIMYLPCLLTDFIEAVKFEYNLTTKPVWILVGVEGAIIALTFVIPFLLDKILNLDGLKLLNTPVNLNSEYVIGEYQQLIKKGKENKNKKNKDDYKEEKKKSFDFTEAATYRDPNEPKNKYAKWFYKKFKNPTWINVAFKIYPQYTDTDLREFHYKYALSGWFNINPQPPNTNSAYGEYTNILKYGKQIRLEYNGRLNSLRVMAEVASDKNVEEKNKSVEVYETKNVIYQKWNYIVINYNRGYIDVFLNGVLVGSISSVSPYLSYDSVTTGAPGGIFGGICNVTYYETPLSKKNIIMNYKTLRTKDMPYIWRISDDINVKIERNKNPDKKLINDIKNLFGIQK